MKNTSNKSHFTRKHIKDRYQNQYYKTIKRPNRPDNPKTIPNNKPNSPTSKTNELHNQHNRGQINNYEKIGKMAPNLTIPHQTADPKEYTQQIKDPNCSQGTPQAKLLLKHPKIHKTRTMETHFSPGQERK